MREAANSMPTRLIRYGLALVSTLILGRLVWLVLATAIADHKALSDPKTALAWRPDTSLALLALAQDHFVRGASAVRDRHEESIVFKPGRNRELTLRSDVSELPSSRAEDIVLERIGRPAVGDIHSVGRWLDLQASRSFYARAVALVENPAPRNALAESLAIAERRSQSSPVAIRCSSEGAGTSLARRHFSQAKALAQRSLVSDPLQAGGLLLLADIEARVGDPTRSVELIRLAGDRSYRDAVAQTRLIDFGISSGDYAGAISRADGLIHAGGITSFLIRDFLTIAAVDARSYSAMSDFLARGPDWRKWLFESLNAYRNPDLGLRLISEVAERGGSIHSADIAPLLRLMAKQSRTVEAYLTWIRFLSDQKKPKAGFIFDGGFTEDPSDIPFEWNASEFPKGSVGFLGEPGVKERTLRIEFVGARDPKTSVHQFMSLPAGRYRLAVEGRAENLRAVRGVVWRISCVEKQERVIAETEPLRGSTQWREIKADFDMPSDACEFPALRLVLKAKSPPELVANGTAYFRKIQLIRLNVESADERDAVNID